MHNSKTYSQELARQAASYGNIVAMYMLYRSAPKVAFGTEQSVNEVVYSLRNVVGSNVATGNTTAGDTAN